MIRLTSGVYRTQQGEMKRAGDTLTLPKEQEKRLVIRGVAEYIQTTDTPKAVFQEGAAGMPQYDDTMKLAQLKALAQEHGIDTSGMKSKQLVIDALNLRFAAPEDREDENDEDNEEDALQAADNEAAPAIQAKEPQV